MSAIQISVINRAEIGYINKTKSKCIIRAQTHGDRLSHIYYKIHVCIFPQVATRDSKQYLQQLMIPESVMGVCRKWGGGSTTSDKSSTFDVNQDWK